MPMRACTLNGENIHSLADLYDRLASGLSLPEYFGRNLDALWDVLSTDVAGPFAIRWQHAAASRKSMGRDFRRAVKLLQDLERERDDFTLMIED